MVVKMMNVQANFFVFYVNRILMIVFMEEALEVDQLDFEQPAPSPSVGSRI
jgi:hypothetical protein